MAKMVATETFRAVVNGYSDLFVAGVTIVDDDHEAVRAHPNRFRRLPDLEVERPEVEQATAAPGEKRGTAKAQGRTRSSGKP